MNKKRIISISIAVLLTFLAYNIAIAGLTSEWGTVETKPPAGGVNWAAWLDRGAQTPSEIMTEDAFNCVAGLDTGYTDDGWFMQVRNFNFPRINDNDLIQMSFGGLGTHSGKHWYYSFNWEGGGTDPTQTIHPEVALATENGPPCPTIYPVGVEEFDEYKNFTVNFFGQPNTTYQVYRSTTPSGANNGESNGRYRYQDSVTTNAIGNGVYEDPQAIPLTVNAWYVVIYFDTSGNGQHGCHSEPPSPTGTRVIEFKTEFDLAEKVIRLSWEKVANDILGFNLYRSTSKDIEGDKIYSVWIGDPDADNEGLFSYVDDDALEFGETYYYTLEILGLDMSRENIRPMSISQRAGYSFFIPLIQEGD